MDKVKRDRSVNFTLHERNILISLIKRNQNILENKQSDSSTWKQKEATWEVIKNEFNARSGGVYRSTKTLKVKYEGLKRTVRKKSAAIRSELYRTGGGKNTAPPLDEVEEQIKAMITVSTNGLDSIYDSDVLPQTQNSEVVSTNGLDSIYDTDLIPQTQNSEEVVVPEETFIIFENEGGTLKTTSGTVQDIEKKIDDAVDVKVLHTPTTSTSRSIKWDVTSRRNLKSRKHPALISNIQKKSQFDELTEAKLELVKLQKELLQAEVVEKKKEWEFNEKERHWKEEEYMLRIDKLRKELNN